MWYILDGKPGQIIIETEVAPNFEHGGKHYNYISRGYLSKEELIISTYHGREQLIKKNMCFDCNLWDDRVTEITNNPDRKLVVNGRMYSIASEDNTIVAFRGFGGREFNFLTNTGRVIKSTNVWSGGEVPDYFKDRIPDNAVFI